MGAFSIIHWLIVAPLFLGMLFVPTFVALGNHRSNWPLIMVANLLLGWTGIGWIVILLWAALGWGDKTVKAL
ncbi:MAG: Superinfection immunity protein [Caulobacter sp.]|nr:Superinfection immunity protein [Caulobacter sp.]